MSFSSEIKNKLCTVAADCIGCTVAELRGALYFGGTVSDAGIRFTTENKKIAERALSDLSDGFGIRARAEYGNKMVRINIENVYETENILDGVFGSGDMPFSCCRASFVRGAFLGGGSVTDPRKGYHMEFDTKSETAAKLLGGVLSHMGFASGAAFRKGSFVVYIKGSEEIADILGLMGAPQGAFELINIQAEREMRNDINRRVNCENANTNKAARASSKHLFAISKIRGAGKWDKLPEALKEIAELREEYPEDSLKELGEKTNPPIGKSGVNHRLNRVVAFSENL